MNPSSLLRCISLCGKDAAQHMLEQGVQYAKNLHAAGGLNALAADGLQKEPRDSFEVVQQQKCLQDTKRGSRPGGEVEMGLDTIGGDAALLLTSSDSLGSNCSEDSLVQGV